MACACCAFSSRNGFHEALDRLGHIPLPPYIKREDEPLDRERYQTVYAKQGSAVAAPTAGFTSRPKFCSALRERGIEIAEITLDVGLGTFEPVRTERLEDHKIHAETYEIPKSDGSGDRSVRKAQSVPCWPSEPRWCALWKMRQKKRRRRVNDRSQARPRRNFSLSGKTISRREPTAHEFSFAAVEPAGDGGGFAGAKMCCAPIAMLSMRSTAFIVTATAC